MLTTKEAAFRLGWSIDTVQRWIHRGWMKAHRQINGRWLIPEAEVQRIKEPV